MFGKGKKILQKRERVFFLINEADITAEVYAQMKLDSLSYTIFKLNPKWTTELILRVQNKYS